MDAFGLAMYVAAGLAVMSAVATAVLIGAWDRAGDRRNPIVSAAKLRAPRLPCKEDKGDRSGE